VCAALAKRFDTSPLLRALFIVSTIIPGPQFLIYILLWILIPSED
jgi:phage shock protein PspC (stress-responsive transcriptional regulator)